MKLILDKELINDLKSDSGGFTGNTVKGLGLVWSKLKKGWTYDLRGTEIDASKYGELLRDRNLTKKDLKKTCNETELMYYI
jgi:hypothetical protein